jgi:GNAT superfamily N-acetyltransferase
VKLEVPGLRVRVLTFEDVEALQALLRGCADYFRGADGRTPTSHAAMERLADAAGDDAVELLGLERAGALIGLLELRRVDDALTVVLLLLHPHTRGRGTGRRLVEALVAAARAEGLREISLGVQDHEAGAHAFWQGLGFVEVRHVDGVTDYVRAL